MGVKEDTSVVRYNSANSNNEETLPFLFEIQSMFVQILVSENKIGKSVFLRIDEKYPFYLSPFFQINVNLTSLCTEDTLSLERERERERERVTVEYSSFDNF